ncbi:MAG: ATP phosphoribosyltransferase regulatory subunit, partial [Candidatus Xenobia bacterium]
KLPTAGKEAVVKMLAEVAGLSEDQIARVFQFLEISGTPEQVLDRLADMFSAIAVGQKGIAEMRELLSLIDGAGIDRKHIELDLTIARGLDYYTGTVFETFLTDLPHLGSVMSGGRYDGLIGFFANKDLPAVGISVGLDRLFAGMEELGIVTRANATADALMTQFDRTLMPTYLQICKMLRDKGINVELYHQADKLGKQLQYADRRGIGRAIIIGPDEARAGVAQVKQLAEQRQVQVPIADLPACLTTP